jgi:PKD repeat protein
LGVFSKEVEIKGIIDDFLIIPGTQVCPGEEVSFITGYEPFSVEWDFGDGNYFNQDIYSLYPRYRYFEAGTYTVNLMATNSCGTDTVTRIIEVTPSATPEARPFIKGPSTVCPNEEISFGCEGNFKTYLWDFGDGNTSTLKSPKHVFPDQDGASYQVNLTVWNHCGGSASAEITASVQADVPANAAFHWQNNSIMDPCPNTSIKFTGESSGFHQWYFGDGGYEEGREVMYSFAEPGDYEVLHIVNNACGNTDSLTENIVVSENVSEVVSDLSFHFDVHNYSYDELKWLDTLTVCRGELVELINTSHYENNVEYEWDFGDNEFEVSRDASHRYSSEGEVTITLTATTACGGTTNLSKYVKVVNSLTPASNPGVTPLEICPGEQVFFYDDEFNPENDYTYSIEFGDGNTLEGIKDISNTELRTLAQHQYTETGTISSSEMLELVT